MEPRYANRRLIRLTKMDEIQQQIDLKLSREAQIEFVESFLVHIHIGRMKFPRNLYWKDVVRFFLHWLLYYERCREYEIYGLDKNAVGDILNFMHDFLVFFSNTLSMQTFQKRCAVSKEIVSKIEQFSEEDKLIYSQITIIMDGTHSLTTFHSEIYKRSDWRSYKNKYKAGFNTIIFQLLNGRWIAASDSKPCCLYGDSKLFTDFFPKLTC